ncbi:hypothetical protein V6N11_004764 [Hibiscus sabdariffa]|uniref:RRM domain-containing protein n=1 Tax=Hibiscus sabdariffa TaxID=183260 RepID=A0ABR2SHV9_9ROSI
MGGEQSWRTSKLSGDGGFNRKSKVSDERSSWRKGVSVFVDRVSKKIHRSTLKEAFSLYGNVSDVYIAYNKPRRISMAYTFAFVRSPTLEEAQKAVERGHNRRMDGFFIRVFLGKNERSVGRVNQAWNSWRMANLTSGGGSKGEVRNKSTDKRRSYMLTNGRSYKEVLMAQGSTEARFSDDCQGVEVDFKQVHNRKETKCEHFHFSLPKEEIQWLDYCLVGQVKGMYDAFVVQQALRSDGFRVKKLKVWAILENLPLAAWNVSILTAMENKWGSFICVEEDTLKRIRFDQARILLGVSHVSDIPESTNVFINGKKYRIRVSTAAFEEQRCWIDDMVPHDIDDVLPESQFERGESGKHEIIDSDTNKAAEAHPSMTVDAATLKFGLTQVGPKLLALGEAKRLVDTPIVQQMDPSWLSSGSSETHVPLLDEETCLFKIRPKYLRSCKNLSLTSLRSKVEKIQMWASINNGSGLKHKKSKGKIPLSRSPKEKQAGYASGQRELEVKEEIQKVMETSKALEIQFKGGEEVVSKRIRDVVVECEGIREKAGHELLAKVKPNIGFFQETKLDQVNGNFSRKLWGNVNCGMVFSSAIGSAGGLISFWDTDFFSVSNKIINRRFIVLVGTLREGNHRFGFVNVCGPSSDVEKKEFFEELFIVIARYNIAWVVLLTKAISDHNAILLHSESSNWGLKPFKIFNRWLQKEGFDDLMASIFSNQSRDGHVGGKGGLLRESKMAIKTWAKNQCYDRKESINKLELQIKDLEGKIQSGVLPSTSMAQVSCLRAELWKLFREEEQEWLQKSRLRWFAEADRNTKFFHIYASLLRKNNQVSRLSVGNRELSDPRLNKEAVKNHFSLEYNKILAIEVETMNLPFKKLQPVRVSFLESEFSEEEIWVVIRDSDGNRAPGPDGFNASFGGR